MIRATVTNQSSYDRRREAMLQYIDELDAPAYLIRDAAFLLVHATCSCSRLRTILYVIQRCLSIWLQERRSQLHCIWDRITGNDPLAELDEEHL